ncbi:hypothetical protein, partial [Frankia sp. CiP3]|uniref:hypothetical protein n=1 Tax=Frankia sp. CiP3 TaxID=2880971 RepID=UPI001EF73158
IKSLDSCGTDQLQMGICCFSLRVDTPAVTPGDEVLDSRGRQTREGITIAVVDRQGALSFTSGGQNATNMAAGCLSTTSDNGGTGGAGEPEFAVRRTGPDGE